jgi:hypothetical protein
MKAIGGVDVYIHNFWTSALAAGEWSASLLGRFTLGGKSPRYPLDRRLDGPRAGLDDVEETNCVSSWHANSDPSVVHPAASRYTDYAIPAPNYM